jgi:hypothetical protein
MAKQSARKKAGLGPPPRKAPPVRSKGAPAPRPDRRQWLIGGGIVAVIAVAVVLAVVLTRGGSSPTATTAKHTIPWAEIPGLQTGPPPWNSSSAVLSDRLSLLGLSALGQEGTAIHIHQHLDVYANDKKVTVPALIGIDSAAGFLTELHTHDATGIVHVESPTKSSYTLGQFFGEWGVKLTSRCLGRYCGKLNWWVNGTKLTGNPAQLVLKSHQEIVISAGPPPFNPPKSYKFPQGL